MSACVACQAGAHGGGCYWSFGVDCDCDRCVRLIRTDTDGREIGRAVFSAAPTPGGK